MKKTVRYTPALGALLSFLATVLIAFWAPPLVAQTSGDQEPITIGHKRKIESKVLGEERSLWISTPASYGAGDERYPVLYLLDGDSHFHHTTGIVEFLAANDRIPELIVVAIPNTDRTRDLTPPSSNADDRAQMPTHGGADSFLRFLSDELMPFIESEYRTRPYKILVGHSFGGLFALHALITRPEVFNAYIAISPSLQWSDQELVQQAEAFFENSPELEVDLYMTVGNEGGALLGGVRKVSGILDETTPTGLRWGFRLMEEETHGSVPHRSTYQGLEAVFRGWDVPDLLTVFDQGGLEEIDRRFEQGAQRFGYQRKTPPPTRFWLGYHLIDRRRFDEAATVLEYDPEVPAPSVLLDMLAAGYAKQGDEEKAREYYTTSLLTNPNNDSTRKKLTELGVDVAALIPEVTVPTDILATYVGTYEVTPALIITITLDGSSLIGEGGGQPASELVPVSQTRFAATGEIQLEFQPDDSGKVDRLIVHQVGVQMAGKRIE